MRRQPPTLADRRCRALLRRMMEWVGVLCLLAQLSSALHLVLVEHVRCVEHGELVHADAGERDDHAWAVREVSSSHPAIRSLGSPGDHGHEHCLIRHEPRNLTPLPHAIAERAPEQGGARPALGRDAWVHAVSVYSFAPKASPPI